MESNPTLDSPLARRIALQQQAKERYIQTVRSSKPFSLAIYFGTGIGKTATSIECAKWYLNTFGGGDCLIVCHATGARDITWPKELEKFGEGHPIMQAERCCYQSLKKYKGRHFKVVILDEAHKLTEQHRPFFQENHIESIIVLTATPPRDADKMAIIRELTGENHFTFTADQAIDDGILNEYHVHIFKVKLDEQVPYIPMNGKLLTERQAYLEYCIWLTNTAERHTSPKQVLINVMRFLGTTRTKTLAAEHLANQLRAKNRRFVLFCASIEQAQELSPYVYHSQTDDMDFRRFCDQEINEIGSINQIKEGANIDELDRGIVLQVNTNQLNIIQIIGRFLRRIVGTTSSILILCAEGTYDESWCAKALSKTPKHKITYHQLEQNLYWKSPAI